MSALPPAARLTLARAAELSIDLLASIFARLLAAAPQGQSSDPFREATPTVRLAVHLASVCQSWRAAAAQACSQALPSLELQPRNLSKLVADFVCPCCSVQLDSPQLAAPQTATILQVATPGALVRSKRNIAGEFSVGLGPFRASCVSLHACVYTTGALVSVRFLPTVRALSMCVGASVDDEAVLRSVHRLEHLAQLTVRLQKASHLSLIQPRPGSALQHLTVHLDYCTKSWLGDLTALQAAAAAGLTVALYVTLGEQASCWRRLDGEDREQLWDALVRLPSLNQLCLQDHSRRRARAHSAEVKLLRRVQCRELLLPGGLGEVYAEHLVCNLSSQAVLCRCNQLSVQLPWSWLTARPGVFVLVCDAASPTTVDKCTNTLPAFTELWALVLECFVQGGVYGLPASLFSPGPGGCQVRRNDAATDAYLVTAFVKLGMMEL